MRTLLAWALFGLGLPLLGAASAQTLQVPEKAQVGEAVVLEGRDLPPGRFPLRLEAPDGVETLEVAVEEGAFRLEYAPRVPGEHRLRLSLPSGVVEGRFLALSPVAPELTPEGLQLPWGLLPLPEGPWAGPLVQGERVYVAQGLLVLEAHLGQEGWGSTSPPPRSWPCAPGRRPSCRGTGPCPSPSLPCPSKVRRRTWRPWAGS